MKPKDTNGTEIELGATVCYHGAGSKLKIGKVTRIGKGEDLDLISYCTRPPFINLKIRELGKETEDTIKKSQNVLVLDNLLSTYL